MGLDEEAGRICRWVATDESLVPVGLGLVCAEERREREREKKKKIRGKEEQAARNRGGKKSRKRRNARDQDGGALCTLDREREMRWARNRNGSRGRMGIIALEMQQGSSPYSNLKAATASAKLLTLRRAHMTRSATGDANLLQYTDTPCAPPCIDTRYAVHASI